ncbi:MAG TPA: undecaprenyl-diphosphate phosphatase [Mycobacteriales bacterium]|nr:undecaprenyl-diphosphate phosphatase [Mycobacteriales bacterium]
MRAWQAAVLGGVQGVAEVVPVSSSAQVALLPWLLHWEPPPARTAFVAGLHVGSCAGIAWALRREVVAAVADRRRAGALLASCVPAALAGLAVVDGVERRLGGPDQLAAALAAAGTALLLADRRPQDVVEVGPRELVAVSLAQGAALVPGVSRLGATLTALRVLRVERAEAARTSLVLSLPVTAGAALLPLLRLAAQDRAALRALAPLLAAGVPAAAVAGATTAAAWRGRPAQPAGPAAVYRLGLAAAVAVRLRREARAV